MGMIEVLLEISKEDPEMTVDLGMIEEVIEVVTIGDLVHLEEEVIEAEPVIPLEEMIVEEVDSVEEIAEEIVELMIGDLLPVLCLQQEMIAGMIVVIVETIPLLRRQRRRLPSVNNKVGKKHLMVAMVGLQFLKNKNYDF